MRRMALELPPPHAAPHGSTPACPDRRAACCVAIVIPTVSQDAHLSACLAALRQTVLPPAYTLDVIVVLNGATREVCDVARRAADVRVISSTVNHGFAGGCRRGVASTDAAWLAFLNDDVRVDPGWLLPLLETMHEKPDAGAVAPRVLSADGRVQEIGSMLWRDGTTRPFGRGLPASSLAWRWRRRVDYASACALLVRRAAWECVGGFDEGYHPAYYEDVDFCLRLEAAGYGVWVDPRADVVHAESSSSERAFKHFLFARHRARLVARWAPALATRVDAPQLAEEIAAAETAAAARLQVCRRRILVVDDRTPAHGLGSGFDRMADTVLDLAASGAVVECLATEAPPGFSPDLARAGVAVLEGEPEATLAAALARCDVAIVSRPNNAELVRRVLAARGGTPGPPIVYDAEALYHRRIERQALLVADEAAGVLQTQAARWRATEEGIAAHVDSVVCVSDVEAEFFRQRGDTDVHVLTPWLRRARLTPHGLGGRSGIGFVAGWLAGASSPNGDGLVWFVTDVLPHILAEVPWARLRVTGTLPEALRGLEGPHLRSEGYVADLAGFYASLRVAVAPLRFGAGVKLKTLEAVQHGVPIVATSVGAEGMAAVARAVIVHDDPRAFAAAVVEQLLDVRAWRAQRRLIEAAVHDVPTISPWLTVMQSVTGERRRVGRAV